MAATFSACSALGGLGLLTALGAASGLGSAGAAVP